MLWRSFWAADWIARFSSDVTRTRICSFRGSFCGTIYGLAFDWWVPLPEYFPA